MTQVSFFGTNGNGASGPGSSISFGGAFVAGLAFKVTSSSQYLYGYYVWRSDSSQSASCSCALWALSSATAGTFQTGTDASTSSMVAGQWNYIPLATPFALSTGTTYKAVYGLTGNFNDTQSQFGGSETYSAGITNGPITAFSSPVGQGGTNEAPFTNTYQGSFGTSGSDPTTNLPSTDDVKSNFWLDILVGPAASTNAPAGVAAGTAAAPNATVNTSSSTSAPAAAAAATGRPAGPATAVTANAGVAAAQGGAGASTLTMKFSSTDGNGIESWTSNSPMNSGGNHVVRILRPTSPPAGTPHVFLYCLPVSVEGDSSFGSALDICQGLGTHNTYNATLVEPTFGASPWYADNPNDPALRHESFTVAIRDWCQANIAQTTLGPAVSGTEAHHLLGFSKSGLGGAGLLLNHPGVFGKGAFWDTPWDMDLYTRFDPDSTGAYGTQGNFAARYEMSSANVAARDATFLAVSRWWIAGGVLYPGEASDFDTLLTGLSIPHAYAGTDGDGTHHFDSSWIGPAVAAILAATGTGTAAAAAPAATVSAGARAGVAAAAAAAVQAAVTTSGSTNAPAGSAAALAAVSAAVIAVTVPASAAAAAGAAPAAAAGSARSAPAGIAAASAAAPQPQISAAAAARVAAAIAAAMGTRPSFAAAKSSAAVTALVTSSSAVS